VSRAGCLVMLSAMRRWVADAPDAWTAAGDRGSIRMAGTAPGEQPGGPRNGLGLSEPAVFGYGEANQIRAASSQMAAVSSP